MSRRRPVLRRYRGATVSKTSEYVIPNRRGNPLGDDAPLLPNYLRAFSTFLTINVFRNIYLPGPICLSCFLFCHMGKPLTPLTPLPLASPAHARHHEYDLFSVPPTRSKPSESAMYAKKYQQFRHLRLNTIKALFRAIRHSLLPDHDEF